MSTWHQTAFTNAPCTVRRFLARQETLAVEQIQCRCVIHPLTGTRIWNYISVDYKHGREQNLEFAGLLPPSSTFQPILIILSPGPTSVSHNRTHTSTDNLHLQHEARNKTWIGSESKSPSKRIAVSIYAARGGQQAYPLSTPSQTLAMYMQHDRIRCFFLYAFSFPPMSRQTGLGDVHRKFRLQKEV